MSDLKANSLLLFTNQAYVQRTHPNGQTLPHLTRTVASLQKHFAHEPENDKMKLTLLLVATMALFSSLVLAGPNKGPSKYAKNAAKSKGEGV